MGYREFRDGGIVIGGWPVQFLPVTGALDAEALASAASVEVTLGGQTLTTRVLKPDYLVAKALQVGRMKDYARIAEFLELGIVDPARLTPMLSKFGLHPAWQRFLSARSHAQSPGDR